MAIKRNCFCCNKKLKGLYTNIEDPPYDAVSFSSDGKYGSSIFDPYEENARIEIYICDECLKKKAKLSYYYELEQKTEIKNIQSFDKKLKQDEAIIKERTKKLMAAIKKFKKKRGKMTRKEAEIYCEEVGANPLYADGYDDCIIGVGRIFHDYKIIYDTNKILHKMVEEQGMTTEEAIEFYEYNIVGAYMGEATPIFVENYES